MNNSKRIQSNLLQQNCFVRDVSLSRDLRSVTSDIDFLSQDEVTTSHGVSLVDKVKKYPITPQYVNSFVDSSDYRRDPVSAISNGVKKSNLGDLTEIQSVLSMDSAKQAELYHELSKKFVKPVDPESVDSRPVDKGANV